jgi:hypothetical protein
MAETEWISSIGNESRYLYYILFLVGVGESLTEGKQIWLNFLISGSADT